MWLSSTSGRALPSPLTRAYRFALPGLGSNTCASIPSRASTAWSHLAVSSSLPGGLVVLMATYCERSAAASRPSARHCSSVFGTSGSKTRGGSRTGWDDDPDNPGWGWAMWREGAHAASQRHERTNRAGCRGSVVTGRLS